MNHEVIQIDMNYIYCFEVFHENFGLAFWPQLLHTFFRRVGEKIFSIISKVSLSLILFLDFLFSKNILKIVMTIPEEKIIPNTLIIISNITIIITQMKVTT